jgi:hypothetical protein
LRELPETAKTVHMIKVAAAAASGRGGEVNVARHAAEESVIKCTLAL